MGNIRAEATALVANFCKEDGKYETAIPGVFCIKFSRNRPPRKERWGESLSVILQGTKILTAGRKRYPFPQGSYIATPIAMPLASSICDLSEDKPFVGIILQFDATLLGTLMSTMNETAAEERTPTVRAIYGGEASTPMLETTLRIAKLLSSPKDASVLGPLAVKEMFYHLLQSPDGAAIRQFIQAGSPTQRISQAVATLETYMQDEANVASLAKNANMSRSAFFKHFKDVTGLSPVQYQKRLRLLEARRLIQNEAESAASAAFKVGYNSASQFSREYARMFGDPPVRDMRKAQRAAPAPRAS